MPRLPISRSPVNKSCPHYTPSLPPTHTQVWAGWLSFTQQPFCQHSLSKAGAHLYFSLCWILTLPCSSCPWLPQTTSASQHSNKPHNSRCTHCAARPSAPSICWDTCRIPQSRILSIAVSLKTECMMERPVPLYQHVYYDLLHVN